MLRHCDNIQFSSHQHRPFTHERYAQPLRILKSILIEADAIVCHLQCQFFVLNVKGNKDMLCCCVPSYICKRFLCYAVSRNGDVSRDLRHLGMVKDTGNICSTLEVRHIPL